jgi:uncharacterized membrane protein
MLRWLGRLLRDRRGSITILAGAGLTGVMAVGAIAVDIGSVCYESRRLQGVADAAALAAAGNITNASATAQAAITASGWSRAMTPTVTTGTYTGDASLPVASRFAPGGATPNAARVAVAADSPLFFGRLLGFSTVHLKRTATATRIDQAAFTIGSRLAALDAGLGNQLLTGLTGSSVTLTVADYNALLGVDIDLLSFVKALRTELGLGAASFEQTLSTSTTLPRVLTALGNTLTAAGNSTAASAVAKLAASVPATQTTMAKLADLGALGKQDHAIGSGVIAVNAFSVVETMVQIANGARQVQLDLGALAPGLTSVSATLAVGDRQASSPWLALTNVGSPIVRTAQTRLYIDAALPGSAALRALGIGSVHLPIYAELGEAQARLASMTCRNDTQSVTLEVQPSVGHAAIAEITATNLQNMAVAPAERTASFVDILGIKVSGSARVDLSSNSWQTVPFNTGEVLNHTTRTVSASGVVNSIAGSLVSSLDLTVSVGGVVVPLSPIIALVKPLLTTIAGLLDPVVQTLLDTLGIHLGQADVRIDGVRCGTAALVA